MKILLPALSPTMETGNLVKWLVEEGQKVNSGDLIAEIETDKATMELEAPDDGTINQLVVSEGTENIKVNSLIAILDVEGEDLENDVTPSDEIVTKEQPKKEVDSSISMNSIINKRVLDTPISEHGFTGLAIGAAVAGLKPICEFMTFNFSMQAIDQIINSAAKSLYMSGGEINVPIVFRGPNGAAARVAAQHSQCFISWFSHIPGLLVVAPSNARDAKGLLKSSIRNPNPVIFLEHELLYKEKMMVPEEDEFVIPLGKGKMISEGDDITIIGFSMSVHKILNALPDIKSLNINADIIDLRSIKPLDEDLIYKSVKKTNRVVIVEDGWGNTSFGSHLSYLIQSNCFDYLDSEIIKVSGKDVPMPYAENLESLALPTKDEIVSAVKKVTYKN